MIMKRFLLTKLVVLLGFAQGWACSGEYPTHNYYMMDVAPRNVNLLNLEERFNQYWKTYMDNEHISYRWYREEIMETVSVTNYIPVEPAVRLRNVLLRGRSTADAQFRRGSFRNFQQSRARRNVQSRRRRV